jgi:hypothetical protein
VWALAACRTTPSVPEPGDTPAAPAEPTAPAIDAARLRADVDHLAADALEGRHSLSPSLERAADWLAQRHRALGLAPFGSDPRVRFPLRTGLALRRPPALILHRGERSTPVAAEAFSPMPASASGRARGELVFAGYAARAEEIAPVPADEDGRGARPGHPGYDDLAGIDLKGKIALVLLDAPGRPDLRALFERLTAISEKFTRDAGPLLAAGDQAAMRALHERARRDLAELIQPFVPGGRLPDGFFAIPDDPMTESLSLERLLAPLLTMEIPGPRFEPAENFLRTKLGRLAQAGVAGVVFVRGPRSHLDPASRAADPLPDLADVAPGEASAPFPVVQIHWKDADRLMRAGGRTISRLQADIDRKLVPRSGPVGGLEVALDVELAPIERAVPNVVGHVRGTDLAEEIVVLGAHYDHLGTADDGSCAEVTRRGVADRICNGADDNASGTAMVLELARLAQDGPPPRRTIVFAHFAAEELGLFGSQALAQAPPWETGRVVAMVNLDMIGRLGPKGLAIGGIGSSADWMPLLDEIGNNGLPVVYERAVATRSDHASFYRKAIPVLFFFTGIHADYHRAGDHADKVDIEGMVAIGEIVERVMHALAEGRAIAYRPPTDGDGLSPGLPGEDPDTIEKRVVPRPR